MSEPLTAPINVAITTTAPGEISLQQYYLGHRPFVLLELNDDTEQFDIEAGGGIEDLDQLKLVIGYIAEAIGLPLDPAAERA